MLKTDARYRCLGLGDVALQQANLPAAKQWADKSLRLAQRIEYLSGWTLAHNLLRWVA
ncbi:MAG: hypothetical protein NZ701_17875 [Roseiflexus sp.]|nr:hypothetical protein [Roseiflexus sp.]